MRSISAAKTLAGFTLWMFTLCGGEVTVAQAQTFEHEVIEAHQSEEVRTDADRKRVLERAFDRAALAPHFGIGYRAAAIDAGNAVMNGGSIKFYDGAQPADCSVAVSTQNVLCSITLQSTAFSASTGSGTISASAAGLPLSATISQSGTCAWFRVFRSNGTTAEHDGSVATATANAIVPTTTFTQNVTLQINTWTISHAA